jgi:hypothetical protein
MSKHKIKRAGDKTRIRPIVEGLELRELLSIAPAISLHESRAAIVSQTSFEHGSARSDVRRPGFNSPFGPHNLTPFPQAIAYSLAAAYPPGTAQPTPHEVARQTLVSKFTGTYIVGPPRFTNQAYQVLIKAQGMSNQSFHEYLQMSFFYPKDPSSNQILGIADLIPKNVDITGSFNILDLTGDPFQPTRPNGLPTHFTWTADPNSGGVYLFSNQPGVGAGAGVLDIHFMPGGPLRKRATGGGRVAVVVQGVINTSGVVSDIQVPSTH